ncbi:MAG: hypothetical protein IKI11_01490 [Neisseriaceae bacterium]|nr:hypothetical protein [Neisseriaceae bacterium]
MLIDKKIQTKFHATKRGKNAVSDCLKSFRPITSLAACRWVEDPPYGVTVPL